MSNLDFSIKMNFQPAVDPQKLAAMLNVILKEMKTKLGSFGKSIDLIDGDAMAKEFDKVNAKFQKIGNNTKKVTKDTKAYTDALKGTTSQAGLLGKAFQFNQVTQSISTLTNAIAPFINEFIEFDKQIKNIGTLGFKDFEKFNSSLSSLAAEIPGTAADMANATYQAISAGVQGSVEEVTNFVRVAAKAGVAGMSDTSTAVDGLTSVINAYGLKTSEVDNVASTFFAGIKLGKTSFNELVGSISSFVPSASAMGVGFDQATAAIARYTAMGTPTAQVGTQMNAVFTLLAKGTAPLNKALAVVGTDLDTLRLKLKVPVADGGGLVNVMRDIKLAAEASGVQLAALTGRVEAAKIIESLAGSQDKYNASLATFNSVLGEVDANAAEQAFQVAATSIAAQTDGIMATVQGYFNSVFQEIGTGATTTLSALTQLSPAITGVAGVTSLFGGAFSSLGSHMGTFASSSKTALLAMSGYTRKLVSSIPSMYASATATSTYSLALKSAGTSLKGGATNISLYAKKLITELIPNLFKTVFSMSGMQAGLTALKGGFATMWATALGPITLVLGGLALVGVGVLALYNILNETNEEKLASAKADEEMIAGQKKVNESEQKSIQSKQALIAQYEKLNSKANLTAEEQSKLKDTITKLNEIYPNAISSTKSYEENLKALSDASAEDAQRLSELRNEMVKLETEANKATIKRVEIETVVSADNLKENILDEIDNFFGKNSTKEVNAVKEYVDAIKNAANPEEANRALLAFNTGLWNNPMFDGIPLEAKEAMAKQANDLVGIRTVELEKKSEQAAERINKALNDAFNSGTTDLSQLTSDQKAQIEIDMKTSGKSQEDIEKMFDTIEKDARDLKLGEILSDSTKVNGNLKGAESISTLVDSFKNAETEIEKAALGKLISNIAPEAVSATGKIKDANGDLVTSYALLENKVEESKERQLELNNAKLDGNQGEFFEAIDEEGEKIKENTVSMEKLQEQISQKVRMGADTTELEDQYGKLKAENDSYTKDVVGIAEKWIGAGLESEEMLKKVADATGLSVEESEKLVKNMNEAKDAIEDTEDAAKSLGEQFSLDLTAKSEDFKNKKTELIGLEKARRDAINSGDKEQIKNAEKQYQEQFKATKESNSELKAHEDIKKSQEDLFKITKKKTEKVDSAYQKATKALKIEEQQIKNAEDHFKIEQEMAIAIDGRKKTVEDDLILKQRQVQSLEAQKQQIFEMYKITEDESGEISIGIKAKEVEKEEIQQKIIDINNKISKENIGVVTLNSTLKIEEKELEKKVEEQSRKNLEYQVEIGLRPRFDLVQALESDLINVAKQIEDKSKTISELQNLELTGDITNNQKFKLDTLREEIIKLENDKIAIEKNTKAQYSTIYDEDLAILKAKHSNELSEVEDRVEQERNLRATLIDSTTFYASSNEEAEFDKKMKNIEKLKEAELISEGLFNQKKEDLELDHQHRMQVIQEMSLGSQLEADRQADLTKLEQKKKQLVDELAIEQEKAKATGDTKRFNELNESIAGIESQIADKGDIITSLAGNLQGNITEIFSSLTGNEEQMKEPWRKAFSIIAGALKELASTAITNMILGQLNITAGATGLTGLLLIPAIKGLANAGVSAILNPILSGLLSFSTGGRVDEPTLAWIGDASNSRPGADTEWVFRDDHIQYLMRKVASEYHKELLEVFSSRKEIDIKELNKEILNSYTHVFSKAIEENSKELSKESKEVNIINNSSDSRVQDIFTVNTEKSELVEKAKQIEFYNYVKELSTNNSELFTHSVEKQNEIISNFDNKNYSNIESEKYYEIINTLKQGYLLLNGINNIAVKSEINDLQEKVINKINISEIQSRYSDIYKLNKEELVSTNQAEYSKVNKYLSSLNNETINNSNNVHSLLIDKMKENDVNIVRLFSNVANETKLIQQELKFNTITQNKYNEEFKRVLETNYENEIRNDYFVENMKYVTDEIQTMKVLFKENQFNTENINDFVKNYNKVITTQKEYMTDKISSVDYREVIHQSTINLKSYANGSPFLTSPELAIIGDAGFNNPEIVLNLEQLQDIMQSTSKMTVEALSKKFDEVIEASYEIVDAVNNSGLTDESISNSLNRIKESVRKRSRTS